MTQKLNEIALGYSIGIISALCMLLLGIFGPMGFYGGMMGMMQTAHMFFWISPLGIMVGIIEATILGFVSGWLTAKIYNKFA